jgi:hypothetical protein
MAQTLTPQQIAQYAYRAGFRGRDLLIAVAVALRESGGNPLAYNPESAAGTAKGSGSRGLWQVYGTAHPWANNSTVFDPQANANAAYRVFKESGGRWTPWSTWTNGSALALLPSLSTKLNPTQFATRTNATRISTASTPVLSTPGQLQSSGVIAAGRSSGGLSSAGGISSAGGLTNKPNPVSDFLENIGMGAGSGANPLYDFSAMGIGGVLIIIGLLALFFVSGAAESTAKAGVAIAKVAAI